jgi:hypothetical protein
VDALLAALASGVKVCLATGKARPAALSAMEKVGLEGDSLLSPLPPSHPSTKMLAEQNAERSAMEVWVAMNKMLSRTSQKPLAVHLRLTRAGMRVCRSGGRGGGGGGLIAVH